MKLRFLGKNSTPGDSPTLYASDQGTYVVQGWRVLDQSGLGRLTIPEGHTAVEVPPELFEHLTKDGARSGELKRIEPPVMLTTEQGTLILQGPRMIDPEALSQMRMPDYETCIEVPKSSILALTEESRGSDHQRTTG
ncbi:hypothetical protein [Peterkaempfera bronchialis]|uniref:hypothetical protein n=1 Tax=Peterkaempfera bronchialis TaxID=2126346 RepID=UPI003C2DD15E